MRGLEKLQTTWSIQTWGAFTAMRTLSVDIDDFSENKVRFKNYGMVRTFDDDELFLVTNCVLHKDEEGNVIREGLNTEKKYCDAMRQTVAKWKKQNAWRSLNDGTCKWSLQNM